jgi:hypothetical protein
MSLRAEDFDWLTLFGARPEEARIIQTPARVGQRYGAIEVRLDRQDERAREAERA